MEKSLISVCLAVVLLTTLLASGVSANTIVGGKIYNSDFSKVVEGADVSVTCGSDSLDTISLEDGSYAVVFNTNSCYEAGEVSVSASKGTLAGKGEAIINNSTEEEGEFISIGNINLVAKKTSTESRETRGTWFMCGNTVCDSGETYATCAKDCPKPVEQVVEIVEPNKVDIPEREIVNLGTEQTSNLGITGAVIGNGNDSGKKVNIPIIFGGVFLLLVIALACSSLAKGIRRKVNPPFYP